MTAFFYVLGCVVAALGFAGAFFLGSMADGSIATMPGLALARIVAMLPGFSVAGAGLIFVAIGAVLHRLDRLVDGR